MSSQICEPATSAENKSVVKPSENNMTWYAVLGGNGRIYNTYDIVSTSSSSCAANGYNGYMSGPKSFLFIKIDLDKINFDGFDIDGFLDIRPEDKGMNKESYLSKILMEKKLYCNFVLDNYILDEKDQYNNRHRICKPIDRTDLNLQFMSFKRLNDSFIEMFLDALDLKDSFYIKRHQTGNN